MVAVTDWNTNPNFNVTVDFINIAEGCPAQNINGAIRAVMAGVRSFYDTVPNTTTFALKTSAVFNGVTPQYEGRGGFLHMNDPGLIAGRVVTQPQGTPVPGWLIDGDSIWEY